MDNFLGPSTEKELSKVHLEYSIVGTCKVWLLENMNVFENCKNTPPGFVFSVVDDADYYGDDGCILQDICVSSALLQSTFSIFVRSLKL